MPSSDLRKAATERLESALDWFRTNTLLTPPDVEVLETRIGKDKIVASMKAANQMAGRKETDQFFYCLDPATTYGDLPSDLRKHFEDMQVYFLKVAGRNDIWPKSVDIKIMQNIWRLYSLQLLRIFPALYVGMDADSVQMRCFDIIQHGGLCCGYDGKTKRLCVICPGRTEGV